MVDMMQPPGAAYKVQRRVAGWHDIRLDGISDLVMRARGASVFDIGCNRGMVGFEFAVNGAAVVHGCDNYAEGIATAREVFADLRSVESRFEVIDLAPGVEAMRPFAGRAYDITVCLATYHKLKRIMDPDALAALVQYWGRHTKGYFGWRGTSHQHAENDAEIANLDRDLGAVGFVRIHTSYISTELGVAAIWGRG